MKAVLLVVAGAAIFTANLLAWVQCTLLDSSEFQERVSSALDEPEAQERTATVIANRISASERIQQAIDERLSGELALLAPFLKSQLENGLQATTARVLDSDAYRHLRDEAIIRLHSGVLRVLKDDAAMGVQEDRIVLDLNDFVPAALLELGLEATERSGGGSDRLQEDATIVLVEDAGLARNLSFIARNSDVVAGLLGFIGVACLIGAIAVSPAIRQGVRSSGYIVLGVGILTLLLIFAVDKVIGGLYPERTVLQEVVGSILINLRIQALALAGLGAIAVVAMDRRLLAAGQRAWTASGAYFERTGLPAPLIAAIVVIVFLLAL